MKQFLFLFLFIIAGTFSLFAQPKPEDATTHNQKYYFPASLFNDSIALTRAIPGLAEKILGDFTEKEKKDYGTVMNYYLLTQNYKMAIESIDSVQKKKDDMVEQMEIKIYANAMNNAKTSSVGFDQLFKNDFSAAFNQLTFRKKVSMAFLDTSITNQMHRDYVDITAKLKKNKSDTLGFEDAKSLCDKFIAYSVYDKIYPLMSIYTGEKQYQMMYPAIKSSKWSGVAPVQNITEKADPLMKYKLLMELTGFASKGQEATAKNEINGGLTEVGRKVNLHVAAGVPKKNIDLVVVVHAGALFALLNNDKYKRKYGIDNPNIAIIKELQDFGAKFIVCGQAMTFLRLEIEDLVPGIRQALTAQTVLSTYQLKGYTYYNITLD
jgi:intracellular sulfur oxidation DsrE/DsrF family protein